MLRKIEIVLGILILLGLATTFGLGFIEGYVQGYSETFISFDNITYVSDLVWKLSIIPYFFIKTINFKNNKSNSN